jgi:hypothetical protein
MRSVGTESTWSCASPFMATASSGPSWRTTSARPGAQVGDARRDVRDDPEGDRREGRLAAPIGVVRDKRGLHALLPGLQLVGAAADRLEVEFWSPTFSTTAFGTIDSFTSCANSAGYGVLVFIVTLAGPLASAEAIWSNCESCGLLKFGSMMRGC